MVNKESYDIYTHNIQKKEGNLKGATKKKIRGKFVA